MLFDNQALIFLHRIDIEKRASVIHQTSPSGDACAHDPWHQRADRRGEGCRTTIGQSAPDDRARRPSWTDVGACVASPTDYARTVDELTGARRPA